MTRFIVTANRLLDGEVVYRTAKGTWSPDIADSLVLDDKNAAEALLDRAGTPAEMLHIIGPYVAKVQYTDGKIIPLGQRETIRAQGPTTHPQFAKSAAEDAHV